jgi:hypothetical protein
MNLGFQTREKLTTHIDPPETLNALTRVVAKSHSNTNCSDDFVCTGIISLESPNICKNILDQINQNLIVVQEMA